MIKKIIISVIIFFYSGIFSASPQCSICTKTTQQLGEKPAKGINAAILYLALTPFIVGAYIGYRWWRNQKKY
ncbi:MAG: hypothetical protein N2747_06335 [Chitinophagaceae bacterium]|nr:hypothetical protein [Chitinophagaceae bacterium]